ncbi:hypothetical protein ACFVVL_25300 [Kitasatospora sp. NPDC058115]|uniref:hypothetical protein n=1 Tax=Kitasatospora sp. NPDC058115 TaxID=3346347 RepID=UPI0036D96353
METANRALTADVTAALRYWPGVISAGQKHPPDPVDMTVLPLVAKVGFTDDRLIRFQAKMGDVVIGPAVAPAGRPEPHPFGRILTGLMDLHGISVRDMARAAGLSISTIHMLRHGQHPNVLQARLIAGILDMSEADVRVIAGLDDGGTQ